MCGGSLAWQAGKVFRPEDFCALESMVSAWAHLSELGVDQLTSHDAVAKALVKMKKRHDDLTAQVSSSDGARGGRSAARDEGRARRGRSGVVFGVLEQGRGVVP